MSKRDVLAEILAKKQRAGGSVAAAGYSLAEIERTLATGADVPAQRSLCVVGIASCIEVAVRETVRTLVDSDPTYANRAADLLKNDSRVSFEIVRAFQDRRISIGEFVAHMLQTSSLEQIAAQLELVLGASLRTVLAGVRKFVEPEDSAWFGADEDAHPELPLKPSFIITNVEELLADISALFDARHIAAHEAIFTAVSRDALGRFLSAGRTFIEALAEYVTQTLEPNAPRSALGQSMAAAVAAGEVRRSMDEVFSQLMAALPDEAVDEWPNTRARLTEAQAAFDGFLESEVSFQLALYGASTTYSVRHIEARITSELCRPRHNSLTEMLAAVREWQQRS